MTDLADEKYLRLTTFTHDGRPKHTPVWIADLGDGRLCFTTELESWKVKRINHTPKIELTLCDARGRVADGAVTSTGRAEVVSGDAVDPVDAAIRAKYGVQVAMVRGLARLRSLIGKPSGERAGVIITVD